jgi:hypothetical protein
VTTILLIAAGVATYTLIVLAIARFAATNTRNEPRVPEWDQRVNKREWSDG